MKYKSEIYEIIHQSAIDKFAIGAIPETRMQEYDEMCLVSETDASVAITQRCLSPESSSVPERRGTLDVAWVTPL